MCQKKIYIKGDFKYFEALLAFGVFPKFFPKVHSEISEAKKSKE